MLGERKQALTIPLGLLDTNLLLFRCVNNLDILSTNTMHLNILSNQSLQLGLKVLLLMDVHHGEVDSAILIQRRTDVQPRSLDSAANPLGMCVTQVLTTTDVHGDGGAAHVLAVEEKRPPGRLLEKTVLGGH